MTTQEQRWATAERSLDVQSARRIRRTPGVVIAILLLLTLAVGITAAVDLRRLQTPRGAALAWTEAAVFGNCRAFLALSQVDDPTVERRTDDEICRALRAATARARNDVTRISITPKSVVQQGRSADVLVQVRDPDGVHEVRLHLVHRGDDWLVVRSAGACGDVTCY
ncbi:MAG: hypothetical protein QOE05_2670 [Actinomycetota bacterium]|nr:hypothetical protein [Actinomycetota bacterium]